MSSRRESEFARLVPVLQQQLFERIYEYIPRDAELFSCTQYRLFASEKDFEPYQHLAVERPTKHIISHLQQIEGARRAFNLGEGIIFENHANTHSDRNEKVQQSLHNLRISSKRQASSSNPKPRNADQISVEADGTRSFCMVVEYKPSHKLSVFILRAGLLRADRGSEIFRRMSSIGSQYITCRSRFRLGDKQSHRWDVKAGCFANEDLHQDKLRAGQQSLRSTQDQINLHGDDGATQKTPKELAPQSQLTMLNEISGEGSRGYISDPERDMLMAFEQEELSTASSSPGPCQLFQLQIDKDHWSKLQSDLHPRSQEEKGGLRQQQEQEVAVEVAVDEIREARLEDGDLNAHNLHNNDNDGNNGNNDTGERGQRGEKRQHNRTRSITRIICQSESSGRINHTDDKDEDNPRPMKRSRVSPDSPPTPPPEHSPTPCLGEPHDTTPSSTAVLERDEQPPQADHRYLSTPADSEYHSTLPRSKLETLPQNVVAEYREWPF